MTIQEATFEESKIKNINIAGQPFNKAVKQSKRAPGAQKSKLAQKEH